MCCEFIRLCCGVYTYLSSDAQLGLEAPSRVELVADICTILCVCGGLSWTRVADDHDYVVGWDVVLYEKIVDICLCLYVCR